MTPAEVAKLLAKAAAYDQRTVGTADVAAWHEVISDIDFADGLAAVARHFATTDVRLMPVHIRRGAETIARERKRLAREAAEAEQAAIEAENRGALIDRSAEVIDLVQRARVDIPPGNHDRLRRPEILMWERRRRRERQADAGPNPHFKALPPPGGHPEPGEIGA